MLHATWTRGSLRFWIFTGMALTVLPLAVSAVIVYAVLNHGVIASFQDVTARQRDQIAPMQQLQIDLWETAALLDLYLDDGNHKDAAAYRAGRERIEGEFAGVLRAFANESQVQILVSRARDDWTEADRAASRILSLRWVADDPTAIDLAKQVDSLVAATVDKLAAAHSDVKLDLDRDHAGALLAYERSEWVTGIAATTSLLLMIAGVLVIGQFLRRSINRLVDGAARFAAGDRDHRIDVQVPPELSKVAEEFNQMIVRIRDSEAELADLARRDRLTGLLNRRAFEEVLHESLAKRRRRNEDLALLILDLDHFKQINDTHGHAAGDAVLRATANAITSTLRDGDSAFRIGGEEFAVLLVGANQAAAETKAERVRTAIAAHSVAIDDRDVHVTVSIGLAVPDGTLDDQGLVKAADAALYRAKADGRNRVAVAA